LEEDANVEYPNSKDQTPLQAAQLLTPCRHDIVEELLKKNANVTYDQAAIRAELGISVRFGQASIVQLLLDRKISQHRTNLDLPAPAASRRSEIV